MSIKCHDVYGLGVGCSNRNGCCCECSERDKKDCYCPTAKLFHFDSKEIMEKCACATKLPDKGE